MTITPRRYQIRTQENFIPWANSPSKLATIILPTGTGKTVTAGLCINTQPGATVLWVAHREELIDQAFNSLKDTVQWAQSIQIDKADQKADPKSDIIVGSTQTLSRTRKHLENYSPNIIVIDEYHHYSENNKTYAGLLKKYPNAKVLGLTATPWRFSGQEDLPLGEILIEMDVGAAIRHGYLVPAVPEVLKSNVSLANVKTTMGDFDAKQLAQIVNVEERNKLIANRIIEMVKDQKRQGFFFGVDVKHAHDMYELLKNEIRCSEIFGSTDKDERKYIVEKIRGGEIDCITNYGIFTEGTDIPHLSFAAIARPTKSLQLYIQMSGRPLRLFPNKKDAIILDVYDKLKIKQNRVTFKDMADHGDMFGDKQRANNILTANLSWDPITPSSSKSSNDTVVFNKLKNFPIFVIDSNEQRWTIDDTTFSVSSWMISDYQRLITWSEQKEVNKVVSKRIWEQLEAKPTLAALKQFPIRVKHSTLGFGKIVDIGFGLEVQVEFNDERKFISIEELLVSKSIEEVIPEKEKTKTDRIFYLCFPDNVPEGRLVNMIKIKNDLLIIEDKRMSKFEANKYLMKLAEEANVFWLVKAGVKWKNNPISEDQKRIIEKYIDTGIIRFDFDLNSATKGDASAIMDQIKFQKIINDKFGTDSKSNLIGYNKNAEDI